jgi:hypothetical protein
MMSDSVTFRKGYFYSLRAKRLYGGQLKQGWTVGREMPFREDLTMDAKEWPLPGNV